jgi:catechol 2,3-dioxygenase-like lactoylglutathione lyase family enzyme
LEICLDHTIVHARDPQATATFLAELLGIDPPRRLGHFTVLRVGPTSLDYLPAEGPVTSRHFAFRVTEDQFDIILDRIRARNIPYWADPFHRQPQAINHWDDGNGLYFDDPDGHLIEVITRSYGTGGCEAKNPNPLLNCPDK